MEWTNKPLLIEFVKCEGCLYEPGGREPFRFTEIVECSQCGEHACEACSFCTDIGWLCPDCGEDGEYDRMEPGVRAYEWNQWSGPIPEPGEGEPWIYPGINNALRALEGDGNEGD